MARWQFGAAFVAAAALYLGVTVLGTVLPVIGAVTVICTLAAGVLLGRYAPDPSYAIVGPLVLVLVTVVIGIWGALTGSASLPAALLALAIEQSLGTAVLLVGSYTGYVAV
jgi:hypothetical protein